jgi:hypothetical protein
MRGRVGFHARRIPRISRAIAVQGADVFGSLHKARRFRVLIRADLRRRPRAGVVGLFAAAARIG